MRYFRINHATGKENIGGMFPQAISSRNAISVDDPRHLWKNDVGKLSEDVVLPHPILYGRAKQTDLISTMSLDSFGLVISDRLKKIIESSIIKGDGRFFEISLIKRLKEIPYWFLSPVVFRMELINYQDSEIWVEGMGGALIKKLLIQNAGELDLLRKELIVPQGIRIPKVVLIDKVAEAFFQLNYVSGGIGFYVSETLKEKIEAAGCTGIAFEQVEKA